MSRFKYICQLKSEGKTYNVYKDKKTNEYYKIDGITVRRIFGDDIRIAEALTENKIKEKANFKLPYALLVSTLILLKIITTFDAEKLPFFEEKEEIEVDDEFAYDHLLDELGGSTYLNQAISENKTIKDKNIDKYIEILSNVDIDKKDYTLLASKFSEYNFKNEEISIEELTDLLDLNDNGFVASELYCYVNNVKNNDKFMMISNIFAGEKDVIRRLLASENLEALISEKVGAKVSIDDIEENKKVRKYLDAKEEKYSLYDGKLQNNIFNKFICLNKNDEYNYYIDEKDGKLTNITYDFYLFEFKKKIGDDDKVNYSDASDRKLVYFYATAILNDYYIEPTAEDMIYGTLLSLKSDDYLNMFDLYGYLCNYEFDYKKALNLSALCYDRSAIPLLQEVNLCLKEEVKEGNISEAEYLAFIKDVTNYLQSNDYDELKRFWEANKENKSIEGFSLNLKKDCKI